MLILNMAKFQKVRSVNVQLINVRQALGFRWLFLALYDVKGKRIALINLVLLNNKYILNNNGTNIIVII